MKILHIESGLGNQMLDYCDLIALRRVNPNDEFFIENMLYEIAECHSTISMWNGYELEVIFGVHENNIRMLFTNTQWKSILSMVRESKFWIDNWRYSIAICNAFQSQGLNVFDVNPRKTLDSINKRSLIDSFPYIRYKTKMFYYRINPKLAEVKNSIKELIFLEDNRNLYTGHFLKFMYKGNGIELIEDEIRKTFIFPEFTDKRNTEFARFIQNQNSVAIHARRGDFLSQNNYCYKYGYFKRAVTYIKKHICNPVFIFFCDPESVQWTKDNYDIFGLKQATDKIHFVDWNKGPESYRDMQLMSLCKHNIITNSSFGWWGAYLNRYCKKITCSPDPKINTTHYF